MSLVRVLFWLSVVAILTPTRLDAPQGCAKDANSCAQGMATLEAMRDGAISGLLRVKADLVAAKRSRDGERTDFAEDRS